VQSKVSTYPDHDVVVVLDVHGISATALQSAMPAIRRAISQMARRPARVYIILGSLLFEV
jgi:hypothetical protein